MNETATAIKNKDDPQRFNPTWEHREFPNTRPVPPNIKVLFTDDRPAIICRGNLSRSNGLISITRDGIRHEIPIHSIREIVSIPDGYGAEKVSVRNVKPLTS